MDFKLTVYLKSLRDIGTIRQREMKILTKFLSFSALLSICLAITVPKPILIRLCETARLARNFDLNNDEVISSMSAILNNHIRSLESSPRQNQECEAPFKIQNDGLLQIVILLDIVGVINNLLESLQQNSSIPESPPKHPPISSMLSTLNATVQHNFTDVFLDKFYNLFKLPLQSNATIDVDSFVAGSELVSILKDAPSFTTDYCKNIDFPESVDTVNQIEVQKAVLMIISNVLKQDQNATQLTENYSNSIENQLS